MNLNIKFQNASDGIPPNKEIVVIVNGEIHDRFLILVKQPLGFSGFVWSDYALGNTPDDYEHENSDEFIVTHWALSDDVNKSVKAAIASEGGVA